MKIIEPLIHIQEIFREVFQNSHLVINENTAPSDIPEWDSLTHVLLLSKIEKKFGIKFSLDDMLSFENTGDICKAVMRKNES